jgi:signal transduction histidine kinase
VAKHAAARHVWVTLSYMEDEVTVDVRDDGRGFDPDQHYDGGYGLVAMRQRVTELAGELAIESGQDAGTVISARVPA